MGFNQSTDLNFLRVKSVIRGQVKLVAGSSFQHGAIVDLIVNIPIQGNYLNIQIFNEATNTEDFINFYVNNEVVILDILADQGGGATEQVTNISFKTEIPKGSTVSASMRSDVDLSGADIIAFLSGI